MMVEKRMQVEPNVSESIHMRKHSVNISTHNWHQHVTSTEEK